MEKVFKELEENGIMVKEGVERFMYNEALYLKYLKKFLNDQDMPKLLESIGKNEVTEAFHAAHALKSTTGSLAIECLYQKSKPIVETLRGGEFPQMEVIEDFKKNYERIMEVISKC